MHLEIVTPNGKVLDSKVESVTAPGVSGRFQLLNNHADMVSGLEIGSIKIEIDGSEETYSCSGGILEICKNSVSVLTESAEKVSEIDLDRAKRAKQRAEDRIKSNAKDVDGIRAKAALFRSVNRIKLVSK